MPIAKLLREQTIGETRWVALDERGEAAALYLERAHEDARRAVISERLGAHIRKLDSGAGGAFVSLGAKGEGFLRLKPGETFAEGAAVAVEVAAEARRGKLARVRMADGAEAPASGVAGWRASLNGGADAAVEDRAAGDAEIGAAFEEALLASAVLRGGGRLQAERTEALVAADIDTAGRTARGGKAAAALAINLEAAVALARQMLLRGWGGLAVLDCVAPVDKDAGGRIRAAFLEAFREISGRQVKALAPSPFGLMEISADWQVTPLAERMQDGPQTIALDGLRQLEAAARAHRMGRLSLALPPPAQTWLAQSGLGAEARLAQIYGARLEIVTGQAGAAEVKPGA
jgi:ribonuclease E